MRNSDIFNAYVKIAEEQGLVSPVKEETVQPEAPKESAKLKRYKKSPNPRAGSDTIETIEALYGVKPNNSIQYEENIMQAAHPRAVVIAPAHDKMNALVENNIEQNNIMCNITMRVPTGDGHSFRTYASNELLMQLIRVANDMDNMGQDELCKLADECIAGLKKKADFWDTVKEKAKDWLGVGESAAVGYGVGMVGGGILGGALGALFGNPMWGARLGTMFGPKLFAILGGATAALGKTHPHAVDVSTNAKETISQLDDLVKKVPESEPLHNFFVAFQAELSKLASLADQYSALIVKTQSDEQSASHDDAFSVVSAFNDQVELVKKSAQQFNDDVEKGLINRYIEKSKAISWIYTFIDNDVQDVQKSLDALMEAISNFEQSVGNVKQEAQKAIAQAKDQSQKSGYMPASEKTEVPAKSQVPTSNEPEEPATGEYSELMEYLGHKPSPEEVAFFKSLKE